ncbi:hypothetical protein FBZ98_101988 [Rhizobium sp. ERR 922]|uniref:hypothetical protein n=1 Tax=unclassified Rhizobium TaxID=2613769 RepID=UPI0011A6EC9A|nr:MULTISPECIES: hypothetical protein [unclassified Rhizobium]TWB61643.1 hypothetical protein FBZ98_101988 [Rhizobium sp. ERR 922]TWC04569.1 hypothetical protein FBZ97_101988 [Rhizobium sp. ERR 942]
MTLSTLLSKLERSKDFGTGLAQEIMSVCGIRDYETVFHRVLKLVECGATLDAAVALVNRLLPGWYWRCGQTSLFPKGWAFISEGHPDHTSPGVNEFGYTGGKATVCCALLICALRAIHAREGGR